MTVAASAIGIMEWLIQVESALDAGGDHKACEDGQC